MMRSSGPDVVGQVLDGASRDDQLHVAQSLEIVERIPRHGNHVGVLPHLEGAEPVAASDGGAACLRAGVTERAASYAYVPFFPGTRPILARSLRSAAEIRKTFLDAGFQLLNHTHPLSEVAESWPDYAERVSKRADSILVQLDDAEFELGLASLRAFASRAPDGPVTEPVDFLVFQRD